MTTPDDMYDIDIIFTHLLAEFKRKTTIDLRESEHPSAERALQRLERACTRATHTLASADSAIVEIIDFFEGLDLCETITRLHLENGTSGTCQIHALTLYEAFWSDVAETTYRNFGDIELRDPIYPYFARTMTTQVNGFQQVNGSHRRSDLPRDAVVDLSEGQILDLFDDLRWAIVDIHEDNGLKLPRDLESTSSTSLRGILKRGHYDY
jgi:hypothetical protein